MAAAACGCCLLPATTRGAACGLQPPAACAAQCPKHSITLGIAATSNASCVADERSLSLALRPGIGAQLEEMVIGAGGTAHMAKDGGGLHVHFQRASSPPRR